MLSAHYAKLFLFFVHWAYLFWINNQPCLSWIHLEMLWLHNDPVGDKTNKYSHQWALQVRYGPPLFDPSTVTVVFLKPERIASELLVA